MNKIKAVILLITAFCMSGKTQTCFDVYTPPEALITKLTRTLVTTESPFPVLTFNEFLAKEILPLEKRYAYVLDQINQVSNGTQLEQLVQSTVALLKTTKENVDRLTAESLKTKPKEDAIKALSEEIRQCHARMSQCRVSLKTHIESLEIYLDAIQKTESMVEQTEHQLNQLKSDLSGLARKYAGDKAQFAVSIELNISRLKSYIESLQMFIEKTRLHFNSAVVLVSHTIPLAERDILNLESKSAIKIGVLQSYFERLRGEVKETAPVKKEVAIDVDMLAKDDHTTAGLEFIHFLEHFHDPKHLGSIEEKFIEIMELKTNRPKYLSLKDMVALFKKLNEYELDFNHFADFYKRNTYNSAVKRRIGIVSDSYNREFVFTAPFSEAIAIYPGPRGEDRTEYLKFWIWGYAQGHEQRGALFPSIGNTKSNPVLRDITNFMGLLPFLNTVYHRSGTNPVLDQYFSFFRTYLETQMAENQAIFDREEANIAALASKSLLKKRKEESLRRNSNFEHVQSEVNLAIIKSILDRLPKIKDAWSSGVINYFITAKTAETDLYLFAESTEFSTHWTRGDKYETVATGRHMKVKLQFDKDSFK
jgi:hypothetical protein